MMKIHPEGIPIINVSWMLLGILALGLNLIFPEQSIFHYLYYAAALVLLIMVLRFFRYPKRKAPDIAQSIISPADGKVVVIEDIEEKEFFNRKMKQVSIFMSVHNVHVNFFPISGQVTYRKYHPGKYLLARNPKASMENEMNCVVIEHPDHGGIMVRQIAGFVARRIVSKVEQDDHVQQGNELGMIRFGSRVDVIMDTSLKIEVSINDKVKAGKSLLACFS